MVWLASALHGDQESVNCLTHFANASEYAGLTNWLSPWLYSLNLCSTHARFLQSKGNDLNRKIDAPTSPSLVLRLRDHADAGAWTEFMDVYSPLLYDFCRARGLQSSDAADVAQEVLLRVAKAVRSFEYDPSKGLFRDWLAKIVINEIRRFGKKRTDFVEATNDLDQDFGNLESMWNEQFQQHIFSKALARCQPHFAPETWKMFERSWIDKLEPELVAKELQISVEQIYVARSRVLKRLRYEVAILADDLL